MPSAGERPDLYLPPNMRALLSALASALTERYPAEIVYLDDYTPFPSGIAEAIRRQWPRLNFSVRSDLEAIQKFSTFPEWMPGMLRRNLAPKRGDWFRRPQDCPPEWLGPGYRRAIVFVTGVFLAKTLRQRCETIILREEGLVNYHSLPITPGRAVVRALAGRNPFRQIMGEEAWVDRIELSHPEGLPPALRRKASALSFSGQLARLDPDTGRDLARVFWPGAVPHEGTGPVALVMSQPIDALGFCTTEEKTALYAHIVGRLSDAGYRVVMKRHPREGDGPPPMAETMPPHFPIEAWPLLSRQKFDVAVALCTSSLNADSLSFSKAALQLVRPEIFRRKELGDWAQVLDAGMRGLSPPA